MKVTKFLACTLLIAGITPANAQLMGLLNKDKTTVNGIVSEKTTETGSTAAAEVAAAGKTYYVSPNGSVRADGLSKDTPFKDLQKAIDVAEEGSSILVAEGNYLGNMDRGYIECGRFCNCADDGKLLKF